MRGFYLKKYGKVSKFTVWIVDGSYIRKNIDIEFCNFGQHYRFKYIPENEFWLDEGTCSKEDEYEILHLLVENGLMSKGKKYEEALEDADLVELAKRRKDPKVKKLLKIKNKNLLIKRVHKKLLKKYSYGRIKTWIVDGRMVRDLLYIDFLLGGHDKVYSFIPKNEIWIDNSIILKKELKYTLLHELYERYMMLKGMKYNEWSEYGIEEGNLPLNKNYPALKIKDAHVYASKLEIKYRKNPKGMDKKINELLVLNN